MAVDLNTTLDDVTLKTTTGQYGEFTLRILKANGLEFSHPYKEERDQPLTKGDSVTLTYEQTKGTKGVFNKLLNIKKRDKQPEIKIDTATTQEKPETYAETKINTPMTSKFDASGLIKGNSVSNGTQLAIARYGKNTSREHVLEAYQDIMWVHQQAEAKK